MKILAIDEGTSSTRAIVFDEQLKACGKAQFPIQSHHTQSGWVEQDALEIWHKTLEACEKAIENAGLQWKDITGIGITNQRETTVIWDKQTGQPIHRAIVWQSKQSLAICNSWKKSGYETKTLKKTGLPIDPYFSASKIKWLLDQYDPKRKIAGSGQWLAGTIDTWLLWKLSGGRIHATDTSNASRTMVYNIHDLKWDAELCSLFEIPMALLPEVLNSSGNLGHTDAAITNGISVPINAAIGDQQSALFAQQCFEKGQAKNTYGTGCFMLMNVGEKPAQPKYGLLSTVAWTIENQTTYALEGSVMVGGLAVQWLRDNLNAFENSNDIELLAQQAKKNNELIVIPAFYGIGTPYWDNKVKGTIIGINSDTNLADIAYSVLQALAFQCEDVMQSMRKAGKTKLDSLKVDGGATSNQLLMQMQADISQIPVIIAHEVESTALGAAMLVKKAHGIPLNIDAQQSKVFYPKIKSDESTKQYQKWKNIMKKLRVLYQ